MFGINWFTAAEYKQPTSDEIVQRFRHVISLGPLSLSLSVCRLRQDSLQSAPEPFWRLKLIAAALNYLLSTYNMISCSASSYDLMALYKSCLLLLLLLEDSVGSYNPRWTWQSMSKKERPNEKSRLHHQTVSAAWYTYRRQQAKCDKIAYCPSNSTTVFWAIVDENIQSYSD